MEHYAIKLAVPLVIVSLVACGAAGGDVPAELQTAVSRANEAFASATRNLDAASLRENFAGEILDSLSSSVDRARQEQRYAVSKLNRIEWVEARQSGDAAEVVTVENWSHRHFRLSTNDCLFEIPGRDVRQTYHLERFADGWKIVRITDDPANSRARRTPCTSGAT